MQIGSVLEDNWNNQIGMEIWNLVNAQKKAFWRSNIFANVMTTLLVAASFILDPGR